MSRTAFALGVLAALAAARLAAATTAADICLPAADPCVVTGKVTVAAGSTLDFGTRTLDVTPTGSLNASEGSVLTILAGYVHIEAGGSIVGTGTSTGADISVKTMGSIAVDAIGTTVGKIDTSAGSQAGDITLTAGTDMTINGLLAARAIGTSGSGGTLTLTGGGDVALGGSLTVFGGSQGGGGFVSVVAPGRITVNNTIDASGGAFGGGLIDLEAGGDLSTTATLDVRCTGQTGDGGTLILLAGGAISLQGSISGMAAGSATSGGGVGASLTIYAQQGVLIGAPIVLAGRSSEGQGGTADISSGGDLVQSAPLQVQGNLSGTDGCGGAVTLSAGGNLNLNAVQVNGSSCPGGTVSATASLAATAAAEINADGTTGGAIMINAGAVTVAGTGNLHANGTTTSPCPPDAPCLVNLQGCSVNVDAGAQLTTQSTGGINLLQARSAMVIGGTLIAQQANDLEYLTQEPTLLASASITPSPTITLNSGLPLCGSCGNCDDGNVCTDDVCNPQSGCMHINNTAACNDGNACTINDTCSGGACVGGPPISCDDSNACTEDSCDPSSGCVHTSIADCCDTDSQCASSDLCTTNNRCVNHACVSDSVNCDDNNPCTDDSCNPATGCVHTNNAAPCDDGNVCTTNDACSGGTCVGGPPPRCGDGVVDTSCGEQCDPPGVKQGCTLCTSTCTLTTTCGDGVLDASCGEECDDGGFNGTPGSRCSSTCTEGPPPLRIPGGGRASTDCDLEWSLAMALPALSRSGLPLTLQKCIDGDPACDFDPTPGNCRFHLWTCVGGADPRISCPAQSVTAVDLMSPTSRQTGSPAAARHALLNALDTLTLPVGPGEKCTNRVDIDVPLRRSLLLLRTKTHTGRGDIDTDLLLLRCAVRR